MFAYRLPKEANLRDIRKSNLQIFLQTFSTFLTATVTITFSMKSLFKISRISSFSRCHNDHSSTKVLTELKESPVLDEFEPGLKRMRLHV